MAEMMTDSGLKYEDLVEGAGAEARAGQQVSVHYTGWLTDGSKFDSSVDRNQPFQFALGRGMVIRGWDEGVAGMKVGGRRKLTIPPQLGYGAAGAGGVIPPRCTNVRAIGQGGKTGDGRARVRGVAGPAGDARRADENTYLQSFYY